ncbi:hypothetical protein M5689_023274 [Euphorbia peplus]|nr:hypothetical protein M5689_023274 [Euphorbia peplus]
MLLRSPISTTKKLFKKTLHTFKSLFSSSSYHRIPKTSPKTNQNIPFSSDMINNRPDLDNFYSDFNDRWPDKKTKKRITPPTLLANKNGKLGERSYEGRDNYEKRWKDDGSKCNNMERRRVEVQEKLKEIEKMDMSNVEHVLDIEEVVHYYSRLTCPAYLDIVDKFFMDMYSEMFSDQL